MITKDELDRLKKPVHKNAEVTYTIGGEIEASVHSNLESERIAAYHQGHRTMHKAVSEFRHNMLYKSREGMARGQFNALPPQDQAIAEKTWNDNHRRSHEQGLARSSEQLKTDTKTAFGNARVNDFAANMKTQNKTQQR